MLEPVGPIKSKTVTSPEKIYDSNALTTNPNPDRTPNALKGVHPSKNKNSLKLEENAQEKIDRLAKAINNYIQSTERVLKIKVHNETGQIMVKVISGADGKVIREIPSEEFLNLAAKVDEMTGLLFNMST